MPAAGAGEHDNTAQPRHLQNVIIGIIGPAFRPQEVVGVGRSERRPDASLGHAIGHRQTAPRDAVAIVLIAVRLHFWI